MNKLKDCILKWKHPYTLKFKAEFFIKIKKIYKVDQLKYDIKFMIINF